MTGGPADGRTVGRWLLSVAVLTGCAQRDRIVVGSKNFTESDLLGEIVAQQIERRTGLSVERRFHLGGTFVCHHAITSGQIDLYVEYTGTAYTAVLKHAPVADRDHGATPRRHALRSEPHLRPGASGAALAGGIRLRVPGACGRLPGARERVRSSVRVPTHRHGSGTDLSRVGGGQSGRDRRKLDGRPDPGAGPPGAGRRPPLLPAL